MPRHSTALPRIRMGTGTLAMGAVLVVMVTQSLSGQLSTLFAAFAGVGVASLLIISVILHELAHALVARAFGGRVTEIALTLMGGHTRYEARGIGPWPSVLISLVGPAVNIVLAIIFGAVQAPLASALLAQGPLEEWKIAVFAVVNLSTTLNWALAIFNLLPGLPMDGGRALESLMTALGLARVRATLVTGWIGRVLAVSVVAFPILGALFFDRPLPSLFLLLWAILVAVSLFTGASSAISHAKITARMAKVSVANIRRPITIMREGATLRDEALYISHGGLYLDGQGRVLVPRTDLVTPERLDAFAHLPVASVVSVGPVAQRAEWTEDALALANMFAKGRAGALVMRDPHDESVASAVLASELATHLEMSPTH